MLVSSENNSDLSQKFYVSLSGINSWKSELFQKTMLQTFILNVINVLYNFDPKKYEKDFKLFLQEVLETINP